MPQENPINAEYAPMCLFKNSDLRVACLRKYGDEEGFAAALQALAVERQRCAPSRGAAAPSAAAVVSAAAAAGAGSAGGAGEDSDGGGAGGGAGDDDEYRPRPPRKRAHLGRR